MRGKAGQAAAPAQGVRVEVAGVTFTLPQGWTATTDKRDEKILKSPDGRFTVLAFWWFPDEPLTAYDDVYNVEQAVIDHEPVTRIYSDFGTRNSIQNVTERARADKDRFIFTLEGEGVSREEVKALHDRIVPTVRYAAGFSGKRPDAGGAGKAMPQDEAGDVAMQAAPTETSPTETAPAGAAPMPGNRTVDFSSGDIAGWSGEVADLSVRSGGPNGGAYMDAFTPGDGRTGYVHAPQSLLGDWRGYAGMRIVLQTGQGQFVPPYEYGGRGDVVIANGSMTASLVFPAPVQAGWHEQQISFAGGAWKLAGAQSLDQVLANVTDFAIRAEYRMGDANAGFASIEWIAGGGAAMASADAAADVDAQPAADAPPEEGNRWATYRNARFGTEVQYPAYLFSLVQESANGDGATFQSANGELKFIVFGQYNYDGFNIRGLAERDAASDRFDEVTYRKTGKDWYVLSGYIGGDIFYRRAVLDPNGVVHVLEITYPRSEKEQMDVVVTQMANTLVP
jgi:hypothetical protein